MHSKNHFVFWGLNGVKDGKKSEIGHIFEYFLGEFALAEGKKGGQFYNPVQHRRVASHARAVQRARVRSLLRQRRVVKLLASALPLQRIETIDEPRDREHAAQGDLFDEGNFFETAHRDDFRIMLVWGDNKLALASLLERFRGKVDLIYIDPPFDFIDFWAIDFHHAPNKPFEHHWQDYRTRRDRSLKTASDIGWKYGNPGKKQICVKVIDVFGVDTTTVVDVKV